MYLSSTGKRTLAIGGVSLLAVAGLVGWTRGTTAPAISSPATFASDPEPVASNPAPALPSNPDSRTIYAASPFGSDAFQTPVRQPVIETSSMTSAPFIQTAAARRRVVAKRRYYRPRRRVIVRRRPFSHSAAIVGGSAAGGAAIGALAGGGKGAALGALVGGGGGLVYDRLTHKKKVVVRR